MLFSILAVLISRFLSTQGNYGIILRDVEASAYDEEYVTEPDFFIDDNNAIVGNFSVIKRPPDGTQGRFFLMGASMGEYVVDIGVDVTLDLCEGFTEPILMGPFLQAIGFNVDNCPPDVGNYGSDGYNLKFDTLPDDFPSNEYKATLEIFFESQKLLVVDLFAKVT